MGRLFEYKCKGCGYIGNANPKGHDSIMMGEQYAYHCEECKDIVYVVNLYGEKPEMIVCPECGSEHLKKWNPKSGKCPKCGGEMEKTDMVLMVD